MIKKILTTASLLLISTTAIAGPAWYAGKIDRVWAYEPNGGFIVTFSEPTAMDDCKHQYAYFKSSTIQPEQLKASLSLALSAFHTGSTVGIVIDKSSYEECIASSIDVRK